MLKFKKSEIEKVAKIITFDSELFGDETMMVIAQLVELSDTANKYGCKITDNVADGWGNYVSVTAVPDKYRHSWSF